MDKQDTLRIVDVEVVSRDHQTAVVTGLVGRNRVVTSAPVMAVDGLSVRAIVPETTTEAIATDGPIVPKAGEQSTVENNRRIKTDEKAQESRMSVRNPIAQTYLWSL